MPRIFLPSLFCLTLLVVSAIPQISPRRVRYLTYEEARAILQSFPDSVSELSSAKSPEAQAAVWPDWVKARDRAVRERLRRGNEDTIVNFLVFGTSFTRQPRVTAEELMRLKQTQDISDQRINSRIDDLIDALFKPKAALGKNERLVFLGSFVTQQGYQLSDVADRSKLRQYLVANLRRVLTEQESYARTVAAARLQGNASEEFIARSKIYRERGLSLDTTLAPNFAIEESLKELRARGLLSPGSVRRVAIVGPGLDFTDKAAGYDFYPEQSIQTFAIIDSLLRLGLTQVKELQVTAFDINSRILEHLARARQRAQQGLSYTVQLPHDINAKWKPDLIRYWEDFGNQVGKPVAPVTVPPALGVLKLRAVRIDPAIVARIKPADLNIVYQRFTQPVNFDLIIATNILVYYDSFEQSLALANIESLLRPGGFLLSNNVLLELPTSRMKSVDYLTVVYSDRPDDGDHIVWYQHTTTVADPRK